MLQINTPADVHNALQYQTIITNEATETRRPNTGRNRKQCPELRTYSFRGYTINEVKASRHAPTFELRNPSDEVVLTGPWIACTNYLYCVFDGE